MGIIQKQAIRGTIITYIGVIIGFFTSTILQPFLLSTAQIGLLRILVSYTNLFSQFFSLGFPSITVKQFPYFRNKTNGHNGFLFLASMVFLAGFFLSVIAFFLFYDQIIISGGEKSEMFGRFALLILPLTFFNMLFNVLDAYLRVLYDAVKGLYYKELLQRIFILVALLLFGLSFVDFKLFVGLYVVAFCIPGLLMIYHLMKLHELSLKPVSGFLTRGMKKELASVGFFGLLSGLGMVLIREVDSIMINSIIGLSATGVYTITYYFGSMVSIPSRSLKRISSSLLATAWKDNDMGTIKEIYYKSCLNQFIIGTFLFLMIILNVDNIFEMLPDEFIAGKWVLIFIGISHLMNMFFGVSDEVIGTSMYYRYNAYTTAILVVLVITTNYLLIPVYGISGAALASMVSFVSIKLLRFMLLLIKLKLQPFNASYLLIIVTGALLYWLVGMIPAVYNWIIDGVIRCGLTGILFTGAMLVMKLSPEINERVYTYLNKIIRK